MKKIQLAPMIKHPPQASRGALIAITIVLSVVFAASMIIVVERLLAYDAYLAAEARV